MATARVDHVGITVPDLDAASSLFIRLLGARPLYRRTYPADLDAAVEARTLLPRQLGTHPDAGYRVEVLRVAGTDLELFEWRAPDLTGAVPRVCDPGGHHLAFEVEDVAATAAAFAAEPGVRVLGEPQILGANHPLAGRAWIYALLPWGTFIELVSRPATRDTR
ncbi:VOC family protein [Parafrankia irregularis]|nr:VOC family protein [Parafrankia irregularis]MBE3200944.1 VOC family protein [Parafrankia sp. CH37]